MEIIFSFPFPYILYLAPPSPRDLFKWPKSGVWCQSIKLKSGLLDGILHYRTYCQILEITVSLCHKLPTFEIKVFPFTLNHCMFLNCLIQHCQHCHCNCKFCDFGLISIQGSSRTWLNQIPLPLSALSGLCTTAGSYTYDHNCSSQSIFSWTTTFPRLCRPWCLYPSDVHSPGC